MFNLTYLYTSSFWLPTGITNANHSALLGKIFLTSWGQQLESKDCKISLQSFNVLSHVCLQSQELESQAKPGFMHMYSLEM